MKERKKLNKLVVILGPTASGKSSMAIKLAKFFNGEIISADSRQIYKEMDIGTNKIPLLYPPLFQKGRIKGGGYMIDITKPNQSFTVAQFKKKVIKIIKDIQKRNKIPFLVGGTGLYISAITDNLKIPEIKPNEKLRKKIEKEIKKYGLGKIYQKLLKLDPGAKNFIEEKNPRRIIRALEVCLTAGKSFSELRKKGEPLFDVLKIGIKTPRQILYKKINRRVDEMLKQGLLKEVENLAKKYSWQLPAMSGIGYKQLGMYLRKEIDLNQAINLIKRDTRRYARRQISWFKRDKNIHWIKNRQKAKKIIKEFLSKD
ncbi:MAG: hypothetical protein Athens101410_75 [Parcubacteria group bacterium Athens1014_10]|nr:MAG: hypothetical protein Athens101410_75 [Parcubacteria group bacterium Athens1014_10]TSD06101.1 MAG: hypothetical protein Athens071412_75 [Parcubacteria group bacterium Athens0714_12]